MAAFVQLKSMSVVTFLIDVRTLFRIGVSIVESRKEEGGEPFRLSFLLPAFLRHSDVAFGVTTDDENVVFIQVSSI